MTRSATLPGCILAALAIPIVLLGLAACLTGCGASALDVARTTTLATGEAVMAAKQAAPEAVHVVEAVARVAHPDDPAARVAALEAATPALLAVGRSVDVAAAAWRALYAALQAWEATDQDAAWTDALACVLRAGARAVEAFRAAGVPAPPELATGLEVASSFAGTCSAQETP